MLGWSIIGFVFLMLTIVFAFLYRGDIWNNWKFACLAINSVILFVIVFACVLLLFGVKKEINDFKYYQEMVQETYNNGDVTDTAINIKVIELNQWLAQAKSSEELYGIFSFYDGKLEDLEYIKIDVGDD